MKLSVKSDYATRAVLSLSRHYGSHEAIRVEDIARENSLTPTYLVQILIELKTGNIVKSIRGKSGGYLLARPPAEISFADVLSCVHGPLFDTPALADNACPPELRDAWKRLAEALQSTASSINFQQLVEATPDPARMFYI